MYLSCACVVLLPSLPPFLPCLACLLGSVPSLLLCHCRDRDDDDDDAFVPAPEDALQKPALPSNANNHTSRCRRCSSSRLYSRSSSVRHACPAKGERTRDALVDRPMANVLAKPAVSWLIHCHWELDANTHDRIRPAPRRALLGSALPVNVDLAFPTSALEFRCTARLLVQALKILRRRFPDSSQ